MQDRNTAHALVTSYSSPVIRDCCSSLRARSLGVAAWGKGTSSNSQQLASVLLRGAENSQNIVGPAHHITESDSHKSRLYSFTARLMRWSSDEFCDISLIASRPTGFHCSIFKWVYLLSQQNYFRNNGSLGVRVPGSMLCVINSDIIFFVFVFSVLC